MARAFPPLPFQKKDNGAEVPFHHSVGAGKFFGCERFCPNLPKLAWKVFVQLLPTNFLPQSSWRPLFWCNHQNKVFMCFYANLGAMFWSQTTLGAIFTGILGLLPRFSFGRALWNPYAPTPNTTAFHNSITGYFIVYQDRLETNLLQLSRHPENSEWFSIISVIIFEVNIVDEQKQT